MNTYNWFKVEICRYIECHCISKTKELFRNQTSITAKDIYPRYPHEKHSEMTISGHWPSIVGTQYCHQRWK